MDRSASQGFRRGVARVVMIGAAVLMGRDEGGARAQSLAPGLLPNDDPLAPAQQALLRGDEGEARRRLAQVEADLAAEAAAGETEGIDRAGLAARREALRSSIALLHASMAPLDSRPDAMIAVAAAWPDTIAADVALVAGLSALKKIATQSFDPVLPLLPPLDAEAGPVESTESEEVLDDERREKWLAGSEQSLAAFRDLLAQDPSRSKRSPPPRDPALRDAAHALLRELSLESFGLIRLHVGRPPLLPLPLAEAVRVRIERVPEQPNSRGGPAGELDLQPHEWLARSPRPPPLFERAFDPSSATAELPALDAGVYVVSIESVAHGWVHARQLLVSDLDLVVQRRPDACIVLALLAGRPASGVAVETSSEDVLTNGTWMKRDGRGTTDERGICVLPAGDGKLVVAQRPAGPDGGAQTAFAFVQSPRRSDEASGELAHVVVDAPFHRRGDVVRGRVAARAFDSVGFPALAGVVETRPRVQPLANTALVVRLWPGTRDEVALAETTDADGVLPFEFKLKADAPHGLVPLIVEHSVVAADGKPQVVRLADESPFRVEAVKRPPLLLDVTWPAPYVADSPRPVVEAVATLPSGAPAAGLAGSFDVVLGSYRERRDFRFDANGRAVLPIACDTLSAPLLRRFVGCDLRLSVVAADGQSVGQARRLEFANGASKGKPDEPDSAEPLRLRCHVADLSAGEIVPIDVDGPARSAVLVSAGRSRFLWNDVVVLDERGRGRVEVPTLREWAPRVTVDAALLEGDGETTRTAALDLDLDPHAAPVAAELVERDARFAPRSKVMLHFTTRGRDGVPCAALVAVAVVDESLFLLGEDRTRAPSTALRPADATSECASGRAGGAESPWRAFGAMVQDGKVSRRQDAVPPGFGGGGAGAPGANGGGEPFPLREDFQPIAAFLAKVRSDEQGRGEFEVTFPDDLARWRVTLVATTADGFGEVTRANVTTERDPSVLLLPPRFLRADDRITIPSVVHCDEARGRVAEIRAAADGGLALVATGTGPERTLLDLVDGGTWRHEWNVVARGDGKGSLRVELFGLGGDDAGGRLDGERRDLPLLARTIERTTARTGIVSDASAAPIVLAPPRLEPVVSSELSVRLLGDRAALLDDASRWLSGYPYGCAEQSISRLVPLFAAARARRLAARSDAVPGPVLTQDQAHRFEVGMARLRDLRSDDGYRWWRGGGLDLRMTPVVLTGLALAREAGLDPEPYGALVDPRRGLLLDCVLALADRGGKARAAFEKVGRIVQEQLSEATRDRDAEQLLAELAVAALRIDPSFERARTAVAGLVEKSQPLSPSLLARAGRALVAAGDRTSARRAWQRLAENGPRARCVVPLEDAPAALAAHRLELARALELPDAEIAAAEAELLALFEDHRFGTTWSTAVALAALAGSTTAPPPPNAPQRLRIRAAGREQTVALDPASEWRATLELGDAPDVALAAESPCDVVAIAERRHRVDGVDGMPWSEPIRLERKLRRVRFSASGEASREEIEPEAGGVYRCAVGEFLEVLVEIRGPLDLTYFVATCPLPAGCELVGRENGAETDGALAEDEQVAWAFEAIGDTGRQYATARFVVGHAGDVAWPAAHAEAMYRPGCSGASLGARLVATAAGAEPAAPIAPWLMPEARHAVLETRIAAAAHAGNRYDRAAALNSLERFPDERVASAVRRDLLREALGWSENVDEFLGVLGIERAWLFSGDAWSAQNGSLPEPEGAARIAWADAIAECDEGIALIGRWRRGDPSLGRTERRLAALAWIGASSWEQFDAPFLVRTLRAEDFGDSPELLLDVREERLERTVHRRRLRDELEQTYEAAASHDGVRSLPADADAVRRLDAWTSVLDFASAGLLPERPSRAAVDLAIDLLRFTPPPLDGAAPLPFEREFSVRIDSLRPLAIPAVRRLLAEDAEGRDAMLEYDDLAALESIDAQEARRYARTRLEELDPDDDLEDRLLWRLLGAVKGEVALASPLGARIVRRIADGRGQIGTHLFDAFPVAERAHLPEPLLLRGLDDSGTRSACEAALATSEPGRRALLAWMLERPRERAEVLDILLPVLDAGTLGGLDLDLLLDSVPDVGEDAAKRLRAEIFARGRRDPVPLAAAMACPRDLRARGLLFEFLVSARFGDVPWRADDPAAPRWRILLRASLGEVDAANEVRALLREAFARAPSPDGMPRDERERLERALLPAATMRDLLDGLLTDLPTDLLIRRFRHVPSADVHAWLDGWEQGNEASRIEWVLEILPGSALIGAWDRIERIAREWRGQMRAAAAEDLALYLFRRTGRPHEFVPEDGERIVFEPRTREEWRDALFARIRFDRALPDFNLEPAGLVVAWHAELVERGLALR